MIHWSLLPVVAGLSLVLTGALRRYALARNLVDIPNARSSHSVPTPRGGGMAIVASFLLALPWLAVAGLASWRLVWALLGAGRASRCSAFWTITGMSRPVGACSGISPPPDGRCSGWVACRR